MLCKQMKIDLIAKIHSYIMEKIVKLIKNYIDLKKIDFKNDISKKNKKCLQGLGNLKVQTSLIFVIILALTRIVFDAVIWIWSLNGDLLLLRTRC